METVPSLSFEFLSRAAPLCKSMREFALGPRVSHELHGFP